LNAGKTFINASHLSFSPFRRRSGEEGTFSINVKHRFLS
jgi:hypothetical protein